MSAIRTLEGVMDDEKMLDDGDDCTTNEALAVGVIMYRTLIRIFWCGMIASAVRIWFIGGDINSVLAFASAIAAYGGAVALTVYYLKNYGIRLPPKVRQLNRKSGSAVPIAEIFFAAVLAYMYHVILYGS